jgi:hypothetical protein
VDGDGDTDVLSASTFGVNKIAWYENDGAPAPGFTEWIISTQAVGSMAVCAADVNGDGHMDVLSASGFDDKIAWYENDGAGHPTFVERVISTGADFARAVAAADVDGDGDVDALSASSTDDAIRWYENDGASPPSFAAHLVSTEADGAAAVHAADLDGDGDVDLLSSSSFDDTIAWYENTMPIAPDPCPADLDDADGVGFSDLMALLTAWGPCPEGGPCAADLDGSGEVGPEDLLMLMMAWGACPGSDGPQPGPPDEPRPRPRRMRSGSPSPHG